MISHHELVSYDQIIGIDLFVRLEQIEYNIIYNFNVSAES